MTLHRIHMTEQPVGECMDCGLSGGHLNGCTTPLMAQKLVQVAAVIDLDAPAKGFITVEALAQNLGLSVMDLRSLVATLLGFVPSSAQATLSVEQTAVVRTHVAA